MTRSTMGVRLDEKTQKRLKILANRRDRSPHYLMKQAVEAYLDREEAIEADKALLKERWRHFELTGETIGHESVLGWAKSLDPSGGG